MPLLRNEGRAARRMCAGGVTVFTALTLSSRERGASDCRSRPKLQALASGRAVSRKNWTIVVRDQRTLTTIGSSLATSWPRPGLRDTWGPAWAL
ncbi:hypothetical protein NDU88_002106 [Pleurodeles waltl]|uniref:Secreted protein n=1 Tax=Pleurodeles waltl TaxID=8319 RepID=A0AAV7Q5S3_PLEWA|nr:hypothetical protein NDU88_002106 [Pleurodeles waltl]